MKRAGREDEAKAVADWIGRRGQLDAVGISMKESKQADDRASSPDSNPDGRQDERSQNANRQGDSELDGRQSNTAHSDSGTNRHHDRKDHWQEIDQRLAEKVAPDADRDHCQHMIRTRQRVLDASDKSAWEAGARMCESWIGSD